MRFICLGFADPAVFGSMSEEEMSAAFEECMAYDDELRRGGHFTGGEALQEPKSAVTLRYATNGVDVTDGPYMETKEFLGGILILEARDLNHAIALISKHPGVRFGPWEIRPADEGVKALIDARNEAVRAER
jgi:hypothetical protein